MTESPEGIPFEPRNLEAPPRSQLVSQIEGLLRNAVLLKLQGRLSTLVFRDTAGHEYRHLLDEQLVLETEQTLWSGGQVTVDELAEPIIKKVIESGFNLDDANAHTTVELEPS